MEHRAPCKHISHHCTHTLPLGLGQKDKTIFRKSHAASQIKVNDPCSHMVANMLPLDPKPVGRVNRSKCTFSEHGHVEYQGMRNAATCKHILCPYTHPIPRVGSKVKAFVLLKVVMPYMKIREWNIEHHASPYYTLSHTRTLEPWDEVKRSKKT